MGMLALDSPLLLSLGNSAIETLQKTPTKPVADPGFPPGGGGANSQSGCANLFFRPKTAWKWKNLDPGGGGVPGAPLRSATENH